MAAAMAWSPNRDRWAARYHFGAPGFHARTRRARSLLATRGSHWDTVIQIGATFDACTTAPAPTFIYCDSNVRVAAENAPYGAVARLNAGEREQMERRERRVYDAAAGVFTMSERLRQSFVDEFGVSPERVTTVYAGANLDSAACVPRSPEVRGPPTILFVGRRWGPKGGPELLQAFQELRTTVPDARLRIVGCTPAVSDPGVEVLGRIDKTHSGAAGRLSQLYREADIFCMPTRFDAFGIVFVEAMLHGVACIGTRHGAVPEIIEDGETGWLVPKGAVKPLRDRLVDAFSDRARLAQMGRRGRMRALRHFTWDRVAEQMEIAMNASTAFRAPGL
jgi:glycosyltransferase involved in cell wall biosynthesis